MVERVETVVVGGGQSGLALSYWLSQMGREHVILERARVADRWQSQRWDSLCLLIPNWSMSLPSYEYDGLDPDGFMGKDEVFEILTNYAERIAAPVRTGVDVTQVRQNGDRDEYVLETSAGEFAARNVVVATGPFGTAFVPEASQSVASNVVQIHSNEYKNPQQLPPGSTLIVGGGSSGFQIAEDLMEAGRRVYLSLGRHEARVRRYRGKDTAWWMSETGQWERKLEDNPDAINAPRGSLTGAGGGHDLSVRKLAYEGATVLGRMRAVEEDQVAIAPDIREAVREGDARTRRSLEMIDRYIAANGISAPPDVQDTWPDPPELTDPILRLDLRAEDVTSIVWATGFRYAFDWIRVPVLGADGAPVHRRGVTGSPGLFFLGLRWLYKFKSSFLHGVGEDAYFIAEQIALRDAGA